MKTTPRTSFKRCSQRRKWKKLIKAKTADYIFSISHSSQNELSVSLPKFMKSQVKLDYKQTQHSLEITSSNFSTDLPQSITSTTSPLENKVTAGMIGRFIGSPSLLPAYTSVPLWKIVVIPVFLFLKSIVNICFVLYNFEADSRTANKFSRE